MDDDLEDQMTDGFLVADTMHTDGELRRLGFYDLQNTRREAVDWINSEIHPAYRGCYEVREIRDGVLLPKE